MRRNRQKSVADLFNSGDITVDHQRVVRIIDHEARLGTGRLFDLFFLDIVDLHLFLLPALRIVGSKPAGLFKSPVRQFLPFGLYHYMGAGNTFGMEPPVISVGEFEGQFIVLEIIFSHINMKSVAAQIMEGLAGDLCFFRAALSADLAALGQFLLDLHQIFLFQGDIQGRADGLQVVDLFFYLSSQFGQCFISTL